MLDDVARANFLRGRGNTVWWASGGDPRVETFGTGPDALGYQVFRPDFDRVLLDSAASAGALVRAQARVRSVAFGDGEAAVDYEQGGRVSTIAGRLVLDCSGRTGVVSRRFRRVQPGHRTYALVGVWERERWDFPDDTHTAVETFEDGWAWSVPVSSTTRHVGVMVGPPSLNDTRVSLNDTPVSFGVAGVGQRYSDAIAKTRALDRRLAGATLQHDWACDASLYFSEPYAGPQFLLVGDAGSFIDPLSSFGVKKALASAWLAAVAAHTSLVHPDRRSVAFEFFSNWERRVYITQLGRSRDFARAAYAEHPSAFWASRANIEIESSPYDLDEVDLPASRFESTSSLNLRYADEVRFEEQPVVRGREIVLERAFAGGMRFAGHVDLVKLAEMACRHHCVPELFDAYCQSCAPVPLPNVVGGLSLLVARGILHERT